ncbi:helix-turn-helix domain-containing protein [Pelagibacterium halotolerans]|uniref:Helix-turn-helix transcriptional regulatory protein n=1 Tax=Pelagibacterium halotolerans (strain DSM 22347 / JCM 15775 / CGMCC 1.7692 / B2) TaxID=1082931 RepID=G4RBI8_PELHB|nr:helix-turn-helix transcriptional regulator [Pelagibacterium halotolerans]AEQ52664.1 helix-turn-helix transcriptional regulatory protein [Pelagibacterium halotolerans B2]QJR17634.1 helix-turn-helix transcriptional regulator [Pelagibacterium halotolerans]SEA84052.1 Transcriptional regulator, contains XRE-family HTH domain [Pelagibacterium halotolerans]
MTPTRLRALRLSRGLSLGKLAATVGTSQSYLWTLENRETNPGADLVSRLASALGMTSGYLLASEHDLAAAEDEAFFRAYLSMPVETRARVRAVASVVGREG